MFIFLLMSTLSLSGTHGPDYAIMHLLSLISGRSALLDHAIFGLTKDMFSSVILLSLVVYAWFGTNRSDRRAGILVGTVMSFFAGVVSRILQLSLPTHLRPLYDADLHFKSPSGLDSGALNHWSSFPSDHAAVVFGLACTIYYADIRIGRLAFALVTLLSASRVYLGVHFPSDVIAGASLGIAVVMATQQFRTSSMVRQLMAKEETNSALFYSLAFYFCFGVATLFNDYRSALSEFAKQLHAHITG